MPDADARADDEREPGVGMQHAAVLQVGALADADAVAVTAQDGGVPDADPVGERHGTDDARAVGDPGSGGDVGDASGQAHQHRRSLSEPVPLPAAACGTACGSSS